MKAVHKLGFRFGDLISYFDPGLLRKPQTASYLKERQNTTAKGKAKATGKLALPADVVDEDSHIVGLQERDQDLVISCSGTGGKHSSLGMSPMERQEVKHKAMLVGV
ncbi:hypothetical protein Sjap_002684 [Stephania japonica]|uniref:Uncharacterized protein n=1 Tax=Stephania japonica TaxID=461633 RepID=A0AAP0KPM8_9MAGN